MGNKTKTNTNKRKDKLRKTKKHLTGGYGEKEVKYVVRKSKLDKTGKNVMLQVFVDTVPMPWADFSITELLRKNMNMVDETLARIKRKKEDDTTLPDDDVIYKETIVLDYKKPRPEPL
jgi:predicted metal-dependent hydrolase